MTRERRMVAPGGWLGLLGGGQLGRMFAMAAQSLGYRVAVLDPARDGPAASVCDEHIEADYLDAPALESLALQCSAVTTEFENVPAQSLAFLAEHCFTTPSAESVAVAQDRIAEKSFIRSCGIAVVPHAVIESPADLDAAGDDLFPGILKASRLGYDGKGQARIASRDEAREAFATFGSMPAVLERRVDLAFEISVVVARGADGGTAIYAPAENLHRRGILAVSIVPSPSLSTSLEADAVAATLRIAHALDYVGVLCVEFFVIDGPEGQGLYVNEIAPRPHNSGHYSIDACVTSQFAQQARIAAGLPLGETRRHSAAVMLNLLGDLWFDDRATDIDEATLPGYVDDASSVDAKATADVDRLIAKAEAAATRSTSKADEADELAAEDGDTRGDTLASDVVDDAAAVLEEGPRERDDDGDEDRPDAAEPDDRERDGDAADGDAAGDTGPASRPTDPSDGIVEPDWAAVLAHPGVNLHLYGKREARRGRKMGHVTIVAEHPDDARRIALDVASTLGIASW